MIRKLLSGTRYSTDAWLPRRAIRIRFLNWCSVFASSGSPGAECIAIRYLAIGRPTESIPRQHVTLVASQGLDSDTRRI